VHCQFIVKFVLLSPGGSMKLKEIEVKNYKIIDDTNPVKIDPRVTALVGKNESGKAPF
jgi:recombinational DNA repair ATPase RecF